MVHDYDAKMAIISLSSTLLFHTMLYWRSDMAQMFIKMMTKKYWLFHKMAEGMVKNHCEVQHLHSGVGFTSISCLWNFLTPLWIFSSCFWRWISKESNAKKIMNGSLLYQRGKVLNVHGSFNMVLQSQDLSTLHIIKHLWDILGYCSEKRPTLSISFFLQQFLILF